MSRRTRKGEAPALAPKVPIREGAAVRPPRLGRARSRLPASNPERAARTLERDFGELAAAVRRLPCCVRGCARRPSDPAHVVAKRIGHAWLDVDGEKIGNIAPLCRSHHTGGRGVTRPQHTIGVPAFDAENRLELLLPHADPRVLPSLAEVAKAVGEWVKAGALGLDDLDAPC